MHNNHRPAIDDCDKENLKRTLKNLESSLSRIEFSPIIFPITFSKYKMSLFLTVCYFELKWGTSQILAWNTMPCSDTKQSLLVF